MSENEEVKIESLLPWLFPIQKNRCPLCFGSGHIDNGMFKTIIDCPDCKGKGFVEPKIKIEPHP